MRNVSDSSRSGTRVCSRGPWASQISSARLLKILCRMPLCNSCSGRTRLEEIENIDGYLRRMLRYMHVSRLSRSAQHLHETALSVADYDSGRLGWTAIEPRAACRRQKSFIKSALYACSRKESSRAGSVLILRFFMSTSQPRSPRC